MSSSDTVRHHFDLSHFSGPLDDLKFHVGLAIFPVTAHDSESLAEAARDNKAIARMSAEQRKSRITHFADAPQEAFPKRQIRRLRLSYDNGDTRFRLRPMAWTATYIPPAARHKQRSKVLRAGGALPCAKLDDLGVEETAETRSVELLAHADLIGTPHDTAVHLVMKHPQLGSTFVPSAACLESHVNSSINQTALIQLVFYILQIRTAGKPSKSRSIRPPISPTSTNMRSAPTRPANKSSNTRSAHAPSARWARR